MNEDKKQAILSAVEAHDTIIISRHKRPDGDAVGSTMGLAALLRASYPEKRVFLDNEDYSEFVAFLGNEGPKPTDGDYQNALVIVVDTGTLDRISNPRATSGDLLVKIDHHIDAKPFGDVSWVEDWRSSACEMIVDFFKTFEDRLILDREAATALYTGMVTDSGRFKYEGTGPETLRLAAVLLERDIDLDRLYAHLYIEDYAVTIFNAKLTEQVNRTKNGVAWLYVDRATRIENGLTLEEASNVVSLMDAIRGSLIWLAFIENDDGSIRVRLRSRFTEVESLAKKYQGGGHAQASGATVYSEDEVRSLIDDADRMLKAYKETHPEDF